MGHSNCFVMVEILSVSHYDHFVRVEIVNMGHVVWLGWKRGLSTCLVGVEMMWVQDFGSSPQFSLRFSINILHKIKMVTSHQN